MLPPRLIVCTYRGGHSHELLVDAMIAHYGYLLVSQTLYEVEGVIDAREHSWTWSLVRPRFIASA